jgi:hypothetical protein
MPGGLGIVRFARSDVATVDPRDLGTPCAAGIHVDDSPHTADLPSVNAAEIEVITRTAQGSADGPVFMLNLNKYRPEAQYPDGQLYTDYMSVLDALLLEVGGKILWRTKVRGHDVGSQDIDAAIGIWYPSHQAFLDLMTAPASSKNLRLRALAIAHADLHGCDAY